MHVLGIIYEFGRSFRLDFVETAHVDYVDFCHDSANQVNLMALAAPSVRPSENKFTWCSLNRSLDFVETAHARPSENKFSWCSLNRSLP